MIMLMYILNNIIIIKMSSINYADFSVFADLYNDTGEKWDRTLSDTAVATLSDCDDALKDYYDAYCSYLVSRKYSTDVIKTYRKNAIIDFYITEKKYDNSFRKALDTYYIENIKDTFHKTLNPPPCFFHEVRMAQKREEREIATDDVAQHYISLKQSYQARYEEMTATAAKAVGNISDTIHGIESDCEEGDGNYGGGNYCGGNYYDNYYDDEYYNMYDSDCYTEYDNYSEGYSDDYDFNE